MSLRTALLLAVLCLLPAVASAQVPDPAQPVHPGFDPANTMRSFTAQDTNWHVRWDLARGVPQFVFGGQRGMLPASASPADFEQAARAVINELSGALGYDDSTLQLERVKRIALAPLGSSDKVVVKFRQVTQGVATWQGHVNVLFSADGKLLAVDNLALPHVAETALDYTTDPAEAARVAADAFRAGTGLAVDSVQSDAEDGYVLFPATVAPGKDAVRAVPAFLFEVAAPHNPMSGATPVKRAYAIAARGPAVVLDSWSLVHEADITGTVNGWGQTGLDADGYGPDVLHALKDVRLTATGVPTVYTDASGNFAMPNQASAKTVTAQLSGQFSIVDNFAGPTASIALLMSPGAPQTFTFNTGLTEQQTAEVNAHTSTEKMRDWLKSLDPAETTLDFPIVSHVNEASTCNAFYDGISLNYYLAGGGCPNSAYATVCWHEEGHWLNDLYSSGNGGDGFGEGAADCWAMYVANDPVVAPNFFGPGSPIRTGLNTNPFCGDANGGCYGEVHADGEPLMGAIWKVRARLQAALGQGPGGDLANHLLLDWFQVFNDSQIKTVIEEHWLALDDDDGNINNGTPHYPHIDGGFQDQGFPGFTLPLFQITHTPVTIVANEGPVPVQADVVELNGTINAVSVFYTTNGGQSWASSPMSLVSGTTWQGQIPGATSPAVVGYYIRASDVNANGNNLPKKAPGDFFAYDVGTLTIHAFNNFEGGTDEGWTHQQIVKQDDWQHGSLFGQSLDPAVAYSGTRVWGNDLGPSGWNGQYQPDVNNQLLSPVFNLSGKTNTRLRFRRWLSVEKGIYDHSDLYVNNTKIWTNAPSVDNIDTSWVYQDFPIGAVADNNSSVQVRFVLITDPGVEMGGWNIDDFSLVSLGPISPTNTFVEYGTGTPGFGGLAPHLSGSGTTTLGGNVSLDVANGKPNATGAWFLGTTQINVPSKLGPFLVGNVLVTFGIPLNGSGAVSIGGPLPSSPSASGLMITAQYWCIDTASATGYAGSNGLTFTIQ